MRITPFHLLVIAMATGAVGAERIVNVRNEGEKKRIRTLAINEEASMPMDFSSSFAAGIEAGSEEDGSVNPFIINGANLDRTVWQQSRRYLVDIRSSNAIGKDGQSCGATRISSQVVLTAARESKKMHVKNVYHLLCCFVSYRILTRYCPSLPDILSSYLLSRLL